MYYVKDRYRSLMSADTLDEHIRVRANPQNLRELNSFAISEIFLRNHINSSEVSVDSSNFS